MEADWEFELGSDAPFIDAGWEGFVDLRSNPERAIELPEATLSPPLGQALVRLNAAASPVWTSKCDLFPILEAGEFDADELDALPSEACCATGCYIDLLPRSHRQWRTPETAADVCKAFCAAFRAIPLRWCRVDLIIRSVAGGTDRNDLGITAYCTACGATVAEAAYALAAALAVFADSISSAALPAQPG